MKMVSYCPDCEAAMLVLAKCSGVPTAGSRPGNEAWVDYHIVEVHLGIKRALLVFVMPRQ